MKVHLARHGQAVLFTGQKVLSSLGRKQARLLAKRLDEEEDFNGIVLSSPYLHTLDTAEVMAESLDVPLVPHPGLRERVDRGERRLLKRKRGASLEEMRSLCCMLDVREPIPDRWWTYHLETNEKSIMERMGSFVENVCPPNSDLMCIGHAGSVNSAILYMLRKYDLTQSCGIHSLSELSRAWNCGLTTFEFDGGCVRVLRVHDTRHLSEPLITMNYERKMDLSFTEGS